jgi:DNA-binding HxlR family transcriptional regulator
MTRHPHFSAAEIEAARHYAAPVPHTDLDPRLAPLVNQLIGRIADKWTMLVLEVLMDKGELRFTRLAEMVDGISQKMLTQTLRHMERDGLLIRTVHPVVPPHVDYRLTNLGLTLSAAFCGVWVWAADHLAQIEAARQRFDQRAEAAAATHRSSHPTAQRSSHQS